MKLVYWPSAINIPYSPSNTRANKPFYLVHFNVWGPASDVNSHGFTYFVLFVVDCTQMCWVYFLKHKSEVFDVFVKFYNMIFTQLLLDHGLVHQTSCPDTPQKNGIAERKNRSLLEISQLLRLKLTCLLIFGLKLLLLPPT